MIMGHVNCINGPGARGEGEDGAAVDSKRSFDGSMVVLSELLPQLLL